MGVRVRGLDSALAPGLLHGRLLTDSGWATQACVATGGWLPAAPGRVVARVVAALRAALAAGDERAQRRVLAGLRAAAAACPGALAAPLAAALAAEALAVAERVLGPAEHGAFLAAAFAALAEPLAPAGEDGEAALSLAQRLFAYAAAEEAGVREAPGLATAFADALAGCLRPLPAPALAGLALEAEAAIALALESGKARRRDDAAEKCCTLVAPLLVAEAGAAEMRDAVGLARRLAASARGAGSPELSDRLAEAAAAVLHKFLPAAAADAAAASLLRDALAAGEGEGEGPADPPPPPTRAAAVTAAWVARALAGRGLPGAPAAIDQLGARCFFGGAPAPAALVVDVLVGPRRAARCRRHGWRPRVLYAQWLFARLAPPLAARVEALAVAEGAAAAAPQPAASRVALQRAFARLAGAVPASVLAPGAARWWPLLLAALRAAAAGDEDEEEVSSRSDWVCVGLGTFQSLSSPAGPLSNTHHHHRELT